MALAECFTNRRKINTIGIQQANKVMHLCAMAYNLKKYLKFITKTVKSDTKSASHLFSALKVLFIPKIKTIVRFQF